MSIIREHLSISHPNPKLNSLEVLVRLVTLNRVLRYDAVISSDVARTKTNGCIFFKLRDTQVQAKNTLQSRMTTEKLIAG